jgi:hypothetical protein
MPSKSARPLPAAATGAHAIGTSALGSLAVGAAALGALAIGALSIGRLFVSRARIRRLDIDELVVRRIRVIEELTPPRTSKAVVVSQAVGVSAEAAYAFASRMENLPLWASGLAKGIDQRDGKWFADSPMGEVEVSRCHATEWGQRSQRIPGHALWGGLPAQLRRASTRGRQPGELRRRHCACTT